MYTHAQRETCECTWFDHHRHPRRRECILFRPEAFGTVRILREVPEAIWQSLKEEKRETQRKIPSRGWSLVGSYVSSPSPSLSVVHIFSRELWFFVPLVEGGGTVISATRRNKIDRQGKWNLLSPQPWLNVFTFDLTLYIWSGSRLIGQLGRLN